MATAGTASLVRAGSLMFLNHVKDDAAVRTLPFDLHLLNYSSPDRKFVVDAEEFRASVCACMQSKWVAYGTEILPDFATELKADTTAIIIAVRRNHNREPGDLLHKALHVDGERIMFIIQHYEGETLIYHGHSTMPKGERYALRLLQAVAVFIQSRGSNLPIRVYASRHTLGFWAKACFRCQCNCGFRCNFEDTGITFDLGVYAEESRVPEFCHGLSPQADRGLTVEQVMEELCLEFQYTPPDGWNCLAASLMKCRGIPYSAKGAQQERQAIHQEVKSNLPDEASTREGTLDDGCAAVSRSPFPEPLTNLWLMPCLAACCPLVPNPNICGSGPAPAAGGKT